MSVEAVLLGIAQDAGVPQIGCDCPACAAARADTSLRQRAVSVGLIDTEARASWIIDATPDFRSTRPFSAGRNCPGAT